MWEKTLCPGWEKAGMLHKARRGRFESFHSLHNNTRKTVWSVRREKKIAEIRHRVVSETSPLPYLNDCSFLLEEIRILKGDVNWQKTHRERLVKRVQRVWDLTRERFGRLEEDRIVPQIRDKNGRVIFDVDELMEFVLGQIPQADPPRSTRPLQLD